jgi:hypothetical protein
VVIDVEECCLFGDILVGSWGIFDSADGGMFGVVLERLRVAFDVEAECVLVDILVGSWGTLAEEYDGMVGNMYIIRTREYVRYGEKRWIWGEIER